jgi:hypothetical protein
MGPPSTPPTKSPAEAPMSGWRENKRSKRNVTLPNSDVYSFYHFFILNVSKMMDLFES